MTGSSTRHLSQERLSLLSALVLAAACTPTERCEGDGCGTVVIATSADASTLFPPLAGQNVDFAIGDLLYLKLAEMGVSANTLGDSDFAPRLARSWEFEDSVTIAFSLHPDARWQDGFPVTADDVAFTFSVYRDTLVNAPVAPLIARIASVEARDHRTAVVRFAVPYAEQFYDATQHMRILPKHVFDTIPRGRLATHPLTREPVGNGPYRLIRWSPGGSIELNADPSFFLGRPGIQRLIWRITPDFSTAVTQLVTGAADVMEVIVGAEDVARVEAAEHVRLVEYPSNTYAYIGFNLRDPGNPERPHPILAHRELRRALSLAIDREAVNRAVLGGRAQVPTGPTTPMTWVWDENLRQLPFDQERARRMLDSLGWQPGPDGIRRRAGRRLAFDLIVPTSSQVRQRASVIVQEQLRQAGVDLRLVPLEFNTWRDRAAARRFDAMFGAWFISPSPSGLRQLWTSDGIGRFNYGSYASAVFDSLVSAATEARDRETARQLWIEAFRLINEDAPAVWMFTPVNVAGVHRRLTDVTIRADQWAALIWTWRIPAEQMIERDRVGAASP